MTTTKILQRDGQPWPDAVVGDKNLQFPLQVGKEWTQEIELRAGGGAMLPYRNRYRVEA